jgi:hypothetical protein
MPQAPLKQQTGIEAHVKGKKEAFNGLISRMQAIQKSSEQQLRDLESGLNQGIKLALKTEEQAGQILFTAMQDRKKLAIELLGNSLLIQNIIAAATAAQKEQQKQQQESWKAALTLANQGPEDPIKARIWAIEKQAKSRPILKQD